MPGLPVADLLVTRRRARACALRDTRRRAVAQANRASVRGLEGFVARDPRRPTAVRRPPGVVGPSARQLCTAAPRPKGNSALAWLRQRLPPSLRAKKHAAAQHHDADA